MGLFDKDKPKQTDQKETPTVKPHALIEARDHIFTNYQIQKNVLTLDLEIIDALTGEVQPADDEFFNDLWFEMRVQGYQVSADAIVKIINNKTHLKRVNPVAEFLTGIEWDGKDHIAELAATVKMNLDEDLKAQGDLWPEYLKRWLVASVAGVLSASVNQWCLVLNGGGGKGKSMWGNKLMPMELLNYLFSGHIVPKNTDQSTCNFLAEKWLINLEDQLQGLSGYDYHEMKNIISVPSVTNRKAYHRHQPKRPRIASFIASVDDPSFLIGNNNRRWLVFTIEDINYQHKVDIKQVWAQAVRLWKDGFRYWFSQEENQQLNNINKIYQVMAMEEELLSETFIPASKTTEGAVHISGSTIFNKLQEQTKQTLNTKRFTTALHSQGFVSVSNWVGSLNQSRYGYWVKEIVKNIPNE